VLCIIAYDTEDDASRIANDCRYGLHAAVLGSDLSRARHVASQLRAGRVVINGMTDDPQAPWGGFQILWSRPRIRRVRDRGLRGNAGHPRRDSRDDHT
jgi:Aldehyde dehydrogenase family